MSCANPMNVRADSTIKPMPHDDLPQRLITPSGLPLLQVRDLCVTFPPRPGNAPIRAIEGVSFDVQRGQTLALVGESGSGKTTTGRTILQLQSASSGSVHLLGKELNKLPRSDLRAMRRHMQFVQQNPYASLHPRMTISQILAEPLKVHKSVPTTQISSRTAELLELVGLDKSAVYRYPHEFSGGQRQRIVIARALAVNPDFVVCDEAVSALDVRTQAQIVALLKSLQAKLGLSYLFIAHDLAVVRHIAHRVAVMLGGQIVELGETAQVYENPAHPYTGTLLAAVPIPVPALQRAKLASMPPEHQFLGRQLQADPCVFGEDHAKTGTPTWHWKCPQHGVSCRFWPTGVASGVLSKQ